MLSLALFAAGANTLNTDCAGNGNLCTTGLPGVSAGTPELQAILQLAFGILAAVAVLVISIGGMRYVMSEGNPESTKKARATILYAIIGLIVSLSAEAIVSFAAGKL